MFDDRNDRRHGDRKRLSWRELDQLKDKSRQRDTDPQQKQSSPVALAAQRSYRAALERAFAAGKLEELARTLTRKDEPAPAGTPEKRAPEPQAALATAPSNGSSATAAPASGGAAAASQAAAAVQPVAPAEVAAARAPDPEREGRMKLLGRIREAEGREPVSRAVDAYLARFAKMPDDYEILTKVLSHRSDEHVRATLAQLERMIGREKPRRARTLAAQLRFLEDTHGDPEIRRQAAAVRGLL